MPPGHCLGAHQMLKYRKMKCPHRVLFTKLKMPWCPCPFQKWSIQACPLLHYTKKKILIVVGCSLPTRKCLGALALYKNKAYKPALCSIIQRKKILIAVGCSLPRRKCLGALALSKMKHNNIMTESQMRKWPTWTSHKLCLPDLYIGLVVCPGWWILERISHICGRVKTRQCETLVSKGNCEAPSVLGQKILCVNVW